MEKRCWYPVGKTCCQRPAVLVVGLRDFWCWVAIRLPAAAGCAPWLGNCAVEAEQQGNDKGEGGSPEHRGRVGGFGVAPEIYVTIVRRERVRGFEPCLPIKAK